MSREIHASCFRASKDFHVLSHLGCHKNATGLVTADFELFEVHDETWTFHIVFMERDKQGIS